MKETSDETTEVLIKDGELGGKSLDDSMARGLNPAANEECADGRGRKREFRNGVPGLRYPCGWWEPLPSAPWAIEKDERI